MQEARNLLQQGSSVAICTKEIKERDLANSIIALTKYLQNNGKAVGIIIRETPSKEIAQMFKDNDVVYTHTASPLKYVVSIDYGEAGVEKVLHDIDKDENKVKFYIVPSGKDFDFDDVEYSQEGTSYDSTVVMGIDKFQDMGKIYDEVDYLFKDNSVLAVSRATNEFGDHFIGVDNGTTYSSVVRDIIGEDMTDEIRELLIESVINDMKLLEGEVTTEQMDELCKLVGSGYDINDFLQRKYFSKSYKNLDLQIKLMSNIRVDRKARVVWSIVSQDDLKFAGVNRDNLDTKGRIIFNISSDFDIAIAAYEVEKDLLKVVVESNRPIEYSAQAIAGVFEGRGSDRHAVCIMKNTPRKDFEKNIFMILDNLYSVQVSAEGVSFEKEGRDDVKTIESLAEKAKSDVESLTEKPIDDKTVSESTGKPVVVQDAELDYDDLME